MKIYAIIENNLVINVIIVNNNFIPIDSNYVLADNSVSVGDRYENGIFINNTSTAETTTIAQLTLEEIDAILAMLENENNS